MIASFSSRVARLLALFSVVCCCALSALADGVWRAADVPIPYLRDRTRYVSDPDGILSTAARDSADHYLGLLESRKQVQSLFVIVRRVQDGDAFRMAQDLGNNLGVGDKETRRGLVVVVAVDDRKYFIAPGMGLEAELTDVDCDDIARACIVGAMRRDLPDSAVVATSRALYYKVTTGRTGVADIDDPAESDDIIPIVVLLLVGFSLPIYMAIRGLLERLGIVKPAKKGKGRKGRGRHDDDWFPPFIFGGGGGLGHGGGGGFTGGSFGGGSFGGGGAGGSW